MHDHVHDYVRNYISLNSTDPQPCLVCVYLSSFVRTTLVKLYRLRQCVMWSFKVVRSTWPHLRCDVGLEEGEYRENCLCFLVLCTIIMVHKDTSSSYRSDNCIGL